MVELAYKLRTSLENNSIDDFGYYLNEGWMMKKTLASGISSGNIDAFYDHAIKSGALGGKLLGAGGAGFMLFYCPTYKKEEFLNNMKGYEQLDFGFDDFGSKIIYVGDKF